MRVQSGVLPIGEFMRIRIFLLGFLFLLFTGVNFGQTVEVPQSFVDDATKAFAEVKVLGEALAKSLEERKLSDVERKAAETLIASFDKLLAVKDQINTEQGKVIALYERVIELQSKIIDSLEKRLLKPKSALEKFLKGIKEALLVIAGVALGRGF